MSATPPAQSSRAEVATTQPTRLFWRRAGWAALAITLNLLLADAAVETFLRGSPLRWSVLISVFAALGLSTTAYRRWQWPAPAITGLLALLAVLAFTAWLPGGSEHGVALLGQPTSPVLAGTCGLALLVAAGVFVAARILPVPVRAALALLAVYGATAFFLGAIQSTPFAGLFHGQSLWTRLPRWLQGAFIGGLVILPLALIAQVTTALRTPRRVARAAFATAAWGMVIVLAVSGIQVPPATGLASPSSEATTASAPSPDTSSGASSARPPPA